MRTRRVFSVHNEYTQLKEAIVSSPTNYQQKRPINVVEEYYFKNDPPVRENLVREHKVWTDTLERLGVSLIFLKSQPGLPHQLFTRDIGFAVGEHFYIANMAKKIRKNEVGVLQDWLEKEGIDFRIVPKGTIEGGDILVHYPYVFAGLSQRTNSVAIDGLSRQLGGDWRVIPIQLDPSVLHLDCVLSILSSETVIWCPELVLSHHDLLKGVFGTRIAVSREEAFHMAVNILTINPENVLVEAKQLRLQEELKRVGISLHPIDWSEIKKLGGLFRCATCPIS